VPGTPIYLLEPFIPAIIKQNLKLSIQKIITNFNFYPWNMNTELLKKDQKAFPRIYKTICNHVDNQVLKSSISSHSKSIRAYDGTFAEYLFERIN
jgi:hypothetical protein